MAHWHRVPLLALKKQKLTNPYRCAINPRVMHNAARSGDTQRTKIFRKTSERLRNNLDFEKFK